MMRKLWPSFLVVVLLLAGVDHALGQASLARVEVRALGVSDSDRVKVQIKKSSSKEEYRAIPLSKDNGFRNSATLFPDVYDFEVWKNDVLVLTRNNVVCTVAESQTLEFRLDSPSGGDTGNAQPSEAFAVAVSISALPGASFPQKLLEGLPLGGVRSFDNLVLLLPGVAPPPPAVGDGVGPGVAPGVGSAGQFAVNGLRSRANSFHIDGSDNNDEDVGVRRQGFTTPSPQSIESLQGVSVGTLLTPAQYGRNMGARADVVSRRGDRVNGTLYGFLTNHRLMARDVFDEALGRDEARAITLQGLRGGRLVDVFLDSGRGPQPFRVARDVGGENPLTRVQGGFVFGAPVLKATSPVGSVDAFFAYERQQVRMSRETHFAVPTVEERGLFRSGAVGLVDTAGNPVFPTNLYGDVYLTLFPFPNNPFGPYGRNTFTAVLPADGTGQAASARLFSPPGSGGVTKTLRYNITDDRAFLPAPQGALFSVLEARTRTQSLALLYARTIKRTEVEVRGNFGRTRILLDDAQPRAPVGAESASYENGVINPSGLGLNAPFLLNRADVLLNITLPGDPNPAYERLPRRFLADTEGNTGALGQVLLTGYSPLGADPNHFPQRRVNNTYQLAATARRFFGAALTLDVGYELRRIQLNSRLDRGFRPRMTFSGAFLGANGLLTSADLAAVGVASSVTQTFSTGAPDSTIGLRLWQHQAYGQMTYRKERFQAVLGLRYELNTVPSEVNGRIERSFTAPEVRQFIDFEREGDGRSGLEAFLAGRRRIYRSNPYNFAPRVAFGWEVAEGVVLRGGASLHYDQIPGVILSQSRSVFPAFFQVNLPPSVVLDTRPYVISNPLALRALSQRGTLNQSASNVFQLLGGRNGISFIFGTPPLGVPGGNIAATSILPSLDFFLPDFRLSTPYAAHWGLTLETSRLPLKLAGALSYVGTRGVHLLRVATPNGGSEYGIATFELFPVSGQPAIDAGFRNPTRLFPRLGAYTAFLTDSNASYQALQLEVRRSVGAGGGAVGSFTFGAAYTWSHAIDEVSDIFALAGADALPQNGDNRRAERGSASYDLRHRFAGYALWSAPSPQGGVKRALFGNYDFSTVLTFQTGHPFTVTAPLDVNLDGNLTDRLNATQGLQRVRDGRQVLAFDARVPGDILPLLAVEGASGRVGRNTFRGRGLGFVDLAVTKRFQLGSERYGLRLRVECFNCFNRVNYGLPVRQLLSPGFGQAVGTRVAPRTVQFAVKFDF